MINYFIENTNFVFSKRRECSNWIKSSVAQESIGVKRSIGNLCIIFCPDDYLLDINKKFLSHDYFTDIITFDNSEEKFVSGDIYISVERVKINAENYKQEFSYELHRVIIHGVLHLLGYKDKTKKEKELMREKENFYLNQKYSND